MGEPLTGPIAISAADGFRLWAANYDRAPNALVALEMRLLAEKIGITPGMRFLDAGSGTGRWMQWAQSRGAIVFGIDACRDMVLKAERKAGLAGRSALSDICSIPIADGAVDIVLCSFTLGYTSRPERALPELARVARQVVVSDLHPDAVRAGWTRSFRSRDELYDIAHFGHSVEELDRCARQAGLVQVWRIEASFGEPERRIFAHAGKADAFRAATAVPAVLTTLWRKLSD